MFYDPDGNPMTLEAWAKAFEEKNEWRQVARTIVGYGAGKKMVSTIWIGLNQSDGGSGPPRIFETMLFQKGGRSLTVCERYATKQDALEGHTFYVNTYQYTRRQRRGF